ncbi:MAG: DNA-processing protein DprA [bacterium]|nr:DNA-processing protein DprA [bacterium]
MQNEIHKLTDGESPPLLREIPDAPETLYVRGNTDLLSNPITKFLTVVGSRKYSGYGRQAVEYFVGGLRGYDIAIISGLALGIDALAHKAALDAGLPTIAVPGSGLDEQVLYPRSNTMLARQIVEAGGLLLSEFEPTERAARWTFPQRNRIMVGLAHAVLVIEAEERSGTLITARLTSEYNRELLVVPGSIFSESSKGAHQFLKLGATPVTTPQDILTALHIEARADSDGALSDATLSEEEEKVVELLREPLARDELLERMNMNVTNANILLSKMELDGLITEKMGMVRRV